MRDALRHRAEALGIFRLTTHSHGKEGATVERIREGNNFKLVAFQFAFRGVVFREVVAGVAAGQFQCSFVGLGTRVGEEHALGKREFAESLREPDRRFIGQNVSNMPEFSCLPGECLQHFCVRVPDGTHRDAPGKIDIFFARLIPDA